MADEPEKVGGMDPAWQEIDSQLGVLLDACQELPPGGIEARVAEVAHGGENWRLKALVDEVLILAGQVSSNLASTARPIQRVQIEAAMALLAEDKLRGLSDLRDVVELVRDVIRTAPHKEPPAPYAPPHPQATGSLFSNLLRRIERNRLRATLRELRRTKFELAKRDANGFKPDEMALLGSLSEKLAKTWPFQGAVAMLLLAVALAFGGTVIVGEKSWEVSKDIEDKRAAVETKEKTFEGDAAVELAKLKTVLTALQGDTKDLELKIVREVTEKLNSEIAKRRGELLSTLDNETAKIKDIQGQRLELQQDLEALQDLRSKGIEIARLESAAKGNADKIQGDVTQAATASGSVTAILSSVQKMSERISAQDQNATAFGTRADSLEGRLNRLESEAATLKMVADAVAQLGDLRAIKSEAERNRTAAGAAAQDAAKAEGESHAHVEAISVVRTQLERDAGAVKALRHGLETASGQPQADAASTERLGKIEKKLNDLQETLDVAAILDIASLSGNDCRSVQSALSDAGILRFPKKKGPDGICGASTSFAALAWQERMKQRLPTGRSAQEIAATLRSSAAGNGAKPNQ